MIWFFTTLTTSTFTIRWNRTSRGTIRFRKSPIPVPCNIIRVVNTDRSTYPAAPNGLRVRELCNGRTSVVRIHPRKQDAKQTRVDGNERAVRATGSREREID
jgi:hypothetical protein